MSAAQRPRNMPPRLLIVVVWGFFAGLCLMMARSDGDFTPAIQTGFYVAATVCGLFSTIALVHWIYEVVGAFMGDHKSPWADSDSPPLTRSGDLEETVKASGQEFRYGEGDEAIARDGEPAPDQVVLSPGHRDSSRRGIDVLDILTYIRTVVYAAMGGSLLLGIVLVAVKAVRTWTGFIERGHPDDIYFECVSVSMLLQIPIFLWIRRSQFTAGPLGPWENAVRLLLAAELFSLFTSIALGVAVVVVLAIVMLLSNGAIQ